MFYVRRKLRRIIIELRNYVCITFFSFFSDHKKVYNYISHFYDNAFLSSTWLRKHSYISYKTQYQQQSLITNVKAHAVQELSKYFFIFDYDGWLKFLLFKYSIWSIFTWTKNSKKLLSFVFLFNYSSVCFPFFHNCYPFVIDFRIQSLTFGCLLYA